MDDSDVFSFFMAKSGETAFRKLWAIANSEDTPAATRERLLMWFAEMALGKPRTMDAAPSGSGGSCGVVILPAVLEDGQ